MSKQTVYHEHYSKILWSHSRHGFCWRHGKKTGTTLAGGNTQVDPTGKMAGSREGIVHLTWLFEICARGCLCRRKKRRHLSRPEFDQVCQVPPWAGVVSSGWSCIDYHGHPWPSCQAASLFGFDKNVQKLAPFWRWCSPTVLVQKASRAPRGSVPPLDHTRNDTRRHSGCCVLKPGWNPAWTYIVEQIHFRNVYQAIWSWHLVTQLFCCCPLFGLKCYGLHSCRGLWGASGSSQIRT